jgi:hypothetical protein
MDYPEYVGGRGACGGRHGMTRHFTIAWMLMIGLCAAVLTAGAAAVAGEPPAQDKTKDPPAASAGTIAYAEDAPFFETNAKRKIPGIVISGGTATSADIAAAIQDETKFKKEGNTATLLTNLLIKWDDAILKIENEKWALGAGCFIEVQGALLVDKSEVTSLDHATNARGKIQAFHANHQSKSWTLRITNSKISYLAAIREGAGYDDKPKEVPVFAGNEVVHCSLTPQMGGYLINNWFHQVEQKLSAPGQEAPDSDGNCLIDIKVTKGVGLFDGNLIEDCTMNYLSISWGHGATVANNIYRRLGHIPGGYPFREKQGMYGTHIKGNLFDNSGQPGKHPNAALGYYASVSEKWGEVSGNIISNFGDRAILCFGDGWRRADGKCMYIVKARFSDNVIFSCNEGIALTKDGYHGRNDPNKSWPVDVEMKDNSFLGCKSALSGEGANLVRSGNFVDGKFIDAAPEDLDKKFLRVVLAPAAVWHKGRIRTITVAAVGLRPLKNCEARAKSPDGREVLVRLSEVKQTEYAHDYVGELDTGDFGIGDGTMTVRGQDVTGSECQVTKGFEVREMPSGALAGKKTP